VQTTSMRRKFITAVKNESIDLPVIGTVHHPLLTVGNLTGGAFGLLAIASGIWSIAHFGLTAALVLSLLYAGVCAFIDLASAYHLATAS
jgi:hypothetical protein